MSEIISSATAAASAPLLPALVPARSTACSMVSVVSTPNTTGTPVSVATLWMPLAHGPDTYSKFLQLIDDEMVEARAQHRDARVGFEDRAALDDLHLVHDARAPVR